MKIRSCVGSDGKFRYGIHQPSFIAHNLRPNDHIQPLGTFPDGSLYTNEKNFPETDVEESNADTIFEIPNPFPFRGCTYISKSWADDKAKDPSKILLPKPSHYSFSTVLKELMGEKNSSYENLHNAFNNLPEPILITIAATSTDPSDLVHIAHICCEFNFDPATKRPTGLKYKKEHTGRIRALIRHHTVFETLANNFHLPDDYKEAMVLRPGVQGGSEIIGEIKNDATHIFEYLRRNSYIPWGHYAANMANDAVRYRLEDLTISDMKGLRHLYYQRTYTRLADDIGLKIPFSKKEIKIRELETLRLNLLEKIKRIPQDVKLQFNASLWGWNYGFDFAPSKYRLHASHQQIHQQFALIPASVRARHGKANEEYENESIDTYGCGDLVTNFIKEYRKETGKEFFNNYLEAIRTNKRMDDDPGKAGSLIVYEDENIIVFVPKSQTSQWELQLMPKRPVGNILEADEQERNSIDTGILVAMKILTELGAKMITIIEFPKRFDSREKCQHLLYSFLPRLPESPGAFSEAQLRWINGHYPEDFAISCRSNLSEILEKINHPKTDKYLQGK